MIEFILEVWVYCWLVSMSKQMLMDNECCVVMMLECNPD